MSALSEHREKLIAEHRETAQKFASALNSRWGLRIEPEERGAIADLALCEAAHRYDPECGSSFSTYLYYLVLAELKKVRLQRYRDSKTCCLGSNKDSSALAGPETGGTTEVPSSDPLPDVSLYRKELRRICSEALARLSFLEREVLLRSIVNDASITQMVHQLGYSRGYLCSVKKRGMLRFRRMLGVPQRPRRKVFLDPLKQTFKRAA